MRAIALLGLLVLSGCDRQENDSIEAVPAPTQETSNILMNTAEQAAANAQARMEQEGEANRSSPESHSQGESR